MTSHDGQSIPERTELETLRGVPAAVAPRPASQWSPGEQAQHRATLEKGMSGWQMTDTRAERKRAYGREYGRASARVRKLYRLRGSVAVGRAVQQVQRER
ncbi:hypothetical protein ABZV52_30145 [Streptomyces sp. NPDC004735]|uniref:hypothetical protein n=1 Tax=Streptomyces TaxID=1883 RepID=UPI0033B5C62E